MTLAELLPTFRGMLSTRLEQGLWPRGTTSTSTGDVVVGGVSLSAVASRYGTPSHVFDEAELRARCRDYRLALPDAEIAPAGDHLVRWPPAVRCLTGAGMALAVGSGRGVASTGEAGIPARRVLALSRSGDVGLALAHGCRWITVGTEREALQVARLADEPQKVLVDVTAKHRRGPGAGTVDVDPERAPAVVRTLLGEESLRYAGLRCLVPAAAGVPGFEAAVRQLVRLMAGLRDTYGVATSELAIAGEHAVVRRERDERFDLAGFATRLGVALTWACATNGLRPPRLLVEPGEALVSRAGVALRHVITVAEGLVVLNGAAAGRWARLVGRVSPVAAREVTVVGSDGSVIGGTHLPADVRVGDLLAIPGAGVPATGRLISVSAGVAEVVTA